MDGQYTRRRMRALVVLECLKSRFPGPAGLGLGTSLQKIAYARHDSLWVAKRKKVVGVLQHIR